MTDILVPDEQEGTKAVVRAWLRKVGDRVDKDDPLVELETDKVTQEVPAPAAGILIEILLDTDADALPGALLGRLGEAAVAADAPRAVSPANVALVANGEGEARSAAIAGARNDALSPAVRRAVAQHGIDVATIVGTGRGGRVTRADVDRSLELGAAGQAPPPSATELTEPVAAAGSATGGVRSIPHDRMRLAIARNMLGSVTIAPHVTAVFEADFSAIMAHRRKHKASFEAQGTSLSYTAYIVAAAVKAMAAAPAINSRWFDDRLEIYDSVNVGVGTALGDKGLVVPVIEQAQAKSLFGIAARLAELVKRARDNKLHTADMREGTFTISNHGVSGSLLAAPIIISQPQSAILGIGKLEKRVVVREVDGIDTIQIRPLCYVSLTIDHRVVDGHQTNAWLTRFVEVLEGWSIDG